MMAAQEPSIHESRTVAILLPEADGKPSEEVLRRRLVDSLRRLRQLSVRKWT